MPATALKHLWLITLMLLFGLSRAWATHQRAGEITYRYISPLTYEVTIVTYSYSPSSADRFELDINWGDGTTATLPRSNGPTVNGYHIGEAITSVIKRNLYVGIHTFAGSGTFALSVEDPNRNQGIQNIPNSVDVPLYIESILVINPFVGVNNSPQLLLPPIDNACVGQPFLHNAGAFDPDGDSLSYRLTTCRGANGDFIAGYKLPNEVSQNIGGAFNIDAITGDVIWDKPQMQGEYNIAFLIEEWRNGLKIGSITRDMQITVTTCDNDPPKFDPINDTCVEAGDTLRFRVHATDINADRIHLTATGAPFLVADPAVFGSGYDSVASNTGLFGWATQCHHIRLNPYNVFFKALDDSEPISLFDLKSVNIRVVGPAPKNLIATALGNDIRLKWEKPSCAGVSGYKIYRRNGHSGYIHGYCETGVPAYTGYSLIGSSPDTSFVDSNLSRGVDYCYMTTAIYQGEAEGYASNEACSQLKKDVAVITHVNVLTTDVTTGTMKIQWSMPTEIDPIQAPGPYLYLIYRADGIAGSNFTLIDSLTSLTDTLFIDSGLNTLDQAYRYRVDLWNNTPGNRFRLGPSMPASSVYLICTPADQKANLSFQFNVPWHYYQFVIYRQNPSTLLFDSIGSSTVPEFVDTALVNGNTYCYQVKAIGTYATPSITDPLWNFSQESCTIPLDNEPPCPPLLTIVTDCSLARNVLHIQNPADDLCANDVGMYFIWYKPALSMADFILTDSTTSNTYMHTPANGIAGCYYLVSRDVHANYSLPSDTTCIDADACGPYRIPNLFTPNSDDHNDRLRPFPYTGVEKIDLKILNRWGKLVFSTDDPDIQWDGRVQGSGADASEGVYFYTCDVYMPTLTGTVVKHLKGCVTLLR